MDGGGGERGISSTDVTKSLRRGYCRRLASDLSPRPGRPKCLRREWEGSTHWNVSSDPKAQSHRSRHVTRATVLQKNFTFTQLDTLRIFTIYRLHLDR